MGNRFRDHFTFDLLLFRKIFPDRKRKEPVFTGSQGDKVYHAAAHDAQKRCGANIQTSRAIPAPQPAGPLCQPIADGA